jgi:RNA recognition motif-containing protein
MDRKPTRESPGRATCYTFVANPDGHQRMKLYVGNLPYSVDDDALRALFARHGAVESARVARDDRNGASKGFGFVEMSDGDGMKATAALNGVQHLGRVVYVRDTKPRSVGGGPGGG